MHPAAYDLQSTRIVHSCAKGPLSPCRTCSTTRRWDVDHTRHSLPHAGQRNRLETRAGKLSARSLALCRHVILNLFWLQATGDNTTFTARPGPHSNQKATGMCELPSVYAFFMTCWENIPAVCAGGLRSSYSSMLSPIVLLVWELVSWYVEEAVYYVSD